MGIFLDNMETLRELEHGTREALKDLAKGIKEEVEGQELETA